MFVEKSSPGRRQTGPTSHDFAETVIAFFVPLAYNKDGLGGQSMLRCGGRWRRYRSAQLAIQH
jgi:hypothetical protein